MNLYHRTFTAGAIIRDGFRDSKDNFRTPGVHQGVWVSDEPLDEQDGALGNVVLFISGVPEAAVTEFELKYHDHARPVREYLVPAGVLNRFPIVGIIPDTWIWISGKFEYVGSLINMRPILTKTPREDEPG